MTASFLLSFTLSAESVTLPAGRRGPANRLRGGPNTVHALVLDEAADIFRQGTCDAMAVQASPAGVAFQRSASQDNARGVSQKGTYTSRVIRVEFPFNEVVPSWNVDVVDGTGFVFEMRVGREAGDFWTGFYYLGCWGTIPEVPDKVLQDAHAAIEIDCLRSANAFDRIQYRVRFFAGDREHSPFLRRVGLAYSNTLDDARLAGQHQEPIDPGPKQKWARRLPVPFRSQKNEDAKIRGRICSPTSVAMVMAYRGIHQPTSRLAEVIYDAEHKIFGNWARAVQGAYTFGVSGYIQRFSHFDAVKRHIANGQPIIASIGVAEGLLPNAPYNQSDGHLLVITGFDEDGNVHVNDPAAQTQEAGPVTYSKDDMAKAWFAHGGVGYILLPLSRR